MPYIRMSVSCSWCDTLNEITIKFCRQCGHCAHKARMLCDCPQCLKTDGQTQTAKIKERGDKSKDQG